MITLTCDQCLLPIDLRGSRLSVQPATSEGLDFHNQACLTSYLETHNLNPEPEPEPAPDPDPEPDPTPDPAADPAEVTPEPGTDVPEEHQKLNRDAVTGEFVDAEYAAAHPDTTVTETQ